MKRSERPHVMMYTDGACTGNPGPGGYGVVLKSGQHRKEISAGYRQTTNKLPKASIMDVYTNGRKKVGVAQKDS